NNFMPPGNPASVESASGGKKTKPDDGTKSSIGMTGNIAMSNVSSKGIGATSDGAPKNIGGISGGGETTTTSSQPSGKRTINDVRWKVRMPNLSKVVAERSN